MDFDDFDPDQLAIALGLGEEIAEEEKEYLRMQQEDEKDDFEEDSNDTDYRDL